ncbi:hypothetical protein ZIOFF_025028 [Zingiber officinale]|uniref:MYB-CC type transcription factor LHEQLE-containing domain-containing protein n=1 Tax=Zingiber officinale TaxID=94328 RepID=A0A8J5H9S2_ZINOF|nr:hypothetical protein ZIOFF_025028 [Zingiber officinale]
MAPVSSWILQVTFLLDASKSKPGTRKSRHVSGLTGSCCNCSVPESSAEAVRDEGDETSEGEDPPLKAVNFVLSFQQFGVSIAFAAGCTGATPKGVLRIMGVQGLTIYHVKSHLQKYRLAKYVPEASADGIKSEKKDDGNSIPGLESTSYGNSNNRSTEIADGGTETTSGTTRGKLIGMTVQRQLQLRIEAQGKYLKKIMDEQQRRNGAALAELPGSGNPALTSGDHCLDSEKTDPSTPAPTSESPIQDKVIGGGHGDTDGFYKSISRDDSFSSRCEPLTPDSTFHVSSPSASPKHESTSKRFRVGSIAGQGKSELMVPHILESSSGSDFHQ